MTQLLVSVRSAEEARAALAGGADWIDVKEPMHGSLGRADSASIAAIVAEVAGRRPVSAALGELREQSNAPPIDWQGIAAAKLGLAGELRSHWQTDLRCAWKAFPENVMRVAVAYADWQAADAPPPNAVIEEANLQHCGAFLLDTWNKSSLGLMSIYDRGGLIELVGRARESGMLVVVAGSIDLAALPDVLASNPDFVAVRGAVCRGGRTGQLDEELVRLWQKLVRESSSSPLPRSIPHDCASDTSASPSKLSAANV